MADTDLSLGFLVAEWIEAHCVIPDGFDKGQPFILSSEQLKFTVNHYTVKPSAEVGERATAFTYRRSQLVRAQKWGKSPFIAAFICAEGVGPVLFAGLAEEGDVYYCSDHGCHCGWYYEYEPGEPMGMQWPTPLIQLTATTEDQVENTYDALRPMINDGPLAALIPRTGEEFIRLPNGGRIDVVTSKATSRLGQRVTFVVQDETGIWVKANKMAKVASTQRRGLAGMGGRSIETTNAWDPSEESVGQQTFESQAKDINKDFKHPPNKWQFSLKPDRRKIFKFNYSDCPWVNIDAIEAEAAELMEKSPAEAERFFGNRVVAGDGKWLELGLWERKESPQRVPHGTKVCLGFDGSDVDDWSGIRAETLSGYQFTPTFAGGRKTIWDPKSIPGGRIPREEVHAAVEELFSTYDVVRFYCDPPYWATEVDQWAGRWPKKVFPWETYRPGQMHAALERLKNDVVADDSGFTHDGDEVVATHIRNAVERPRPSQRYILGKASESQKIDLAMSSTLAHEAVGDAIAAGANVSTDNYVYFG